eukprot:7783940-Lingulodinium_polyedra.AAC.1
MVVAMAMLMAMLMAMATALMLMLMLIMFLFYPSTMLPPRVGWLPMPPPAMQPGRCDAAPALFAAA